jgi:hypothetical protein
VEAVGSTLAATSKKKRIPSQESVFFTAAD